jgi:DNA-binding transcriptional ArsR family regulator
MATQDKKSLINPLLVRALGHPLRVVLLNALTEQTLSPNQLKSIVDEHLGHVSYHVRVLEKCDAVELVDLKQRRGATEHFFRATPRAFLGSPDWRRVPKVFRRAVSGASLHTFMDKAIKALEKGKLDADDAAVTWMPLAVDTKGRQEVADICQAATDDLLAIQKKNRRRLARSKTEATTYIVGVMGFEAGA